VDNDTFQALRRKAKRWSADNAEALKTAKPHIPLDFGNRVRQNWRLLLAIAEQAGVGKEARAAAIKLSGKSSRPSPGVRLIRALKPIFTEPFLASEEMAKRLTSDLTAEWCDYESRGPISQKQIACLLAPYGIHPQSLRVPGRPRTAAPLRGYRREWFNIVFVRFAADIRSSATHEPQNPRKIRNK